jgi:thermolabile hemolysin
MWIGGNDLVNYGSTPDKVIAGQQQALTNLIQAGGRNILLLKLPDVSRAPVYQLKGGAATVAAQVLDYNQKLAALAASLNQQYGVNIQVFDSYGLFNDLLTNPGKYQVSNTTQSCLNINTDSALNYMQGQSPRANCGNADAFVFWDTLHPTTHTHLLLGNAVADFLSSSGAMPLLKTLH